MQVLLVLIAAGLLMLAGYSLGKVSGYEEGRRAGEIDAPRPPSVPQTVVLAVLGAGSFTGALLIQGSDGVRVPTPARLEELTGRAERAATRRAERMAEGSEP